MKINAIMYLRVFLTFVVFLLSLAVWLGQKRIIERRIDESPGTIDNSQSLVLLHGMLDVHIMTWPFIIIPVVIFWIVMAGVGMLFRAYKRSIYGPLQK